jgi:hypothetical protein
MRRLSMTLAVLSMLASTWVAAAPAQAGGALDLTCQGTQTINYAPGLVLEPKQVIFKASETFPSCVSVSDQSIKSGTHTATAQMKLGCLTVLEPGKGTKTFTWNNGQTSTFTYTSTATQALGQTVLTLTGTITAGKFAGDTAAQVITTSGDPLGCVASPAGVMSAQGTSTLVLTGS